MLFTQDFVLILVIIALRLEQDEIKVEPTDISSRNFTQILMSIKGRATSTIAFRTPWLYRNVPIMWNVRKRIEIATVNMPGQDFESFHEEAFLLWQAQSPRITSAGNDDQ